MSCPWYNLLLLLACEPNSRKVSELWESKIVCNCNLHQNILGKKKILGITGMFLHCSHLQDLSPQWFHFVWKKKKTIFHFLWLQLCCLAEQNTFHGPVVRTAIMVFYVFALGSGIVFHKNCGKMFSVKKMKTKPILTHCSEKHSPSRVFWIFHGKCSVV